MDPQQVKQQKQVLDMDSNKGKNKRVSRMCTPQKANTNYVQEMGGNKGKPKNTVQDMVSNKSTNTNVLDMPPNQIKNNVQDMGLLLKYSNVTIS